MLTDGPSHARRIADRPTPTPRHTLLAVHRRYELLVALFALALVAILALDAEPASAQTTRGIGAPQFEAIPSDPGPVSAGELLGGADVARRGGHRDSCNARSVAGLLAVACRRRAGD